MINISERTYMRKNAKKKSNKTNRDLILIAVVAAVIVLGVALMLIFLNKPKDSADGQNTNQQSNETNSTPKIPENLAVFNKCRILKMVDNYIAIKSDRTKREYFNSYKVIDDKTEICLEERSKNPTAFVNNTNTVWNERENEEFLNSTQTPKYFLEDLNEKYASKMEISSSRDTELKYYALYYAYWGTLGNFDSSLHHFLIYQYARDLIFEAGATYSTTSDSFNLTITLPYSGQEIVVTQDTDKDSAPTPHSTSNWSGEWWNKV